VDTTRNDQRRLKLNEYIVYLGFLLIFVFFSATLFNRGFLTGTNLLNITQQTTMISVMAIGMTFVLSAGEIDLSIGSVVALSAMITALLLRFTNIFVAVLGGMAVGALVGLINGIFVTRVRIPSFIVTLGMSAIASGFARLITNLESVPVNNDAFNAIFGSPWGRRPCARPPLAGTRSPRAATRCRRSSPASARTASRWRC